MKALVVLLASVLCLGGLPAEAQEAEQDQEIKVYEKIIRPEKRFMIYLSNLDGSGERELVEGSYPSLSPDQKHVAFVRESSLYRLEIETMAEKILLDNEEAYLLNRGPGNPQWHPDGRTIFFDMSNVFLVDLYSIEIDGTKFQEIRKGAGVPLPSRVWPTPFSPDGRKLLYNDCFDACYTLLVLDLETGTSVEISPHTDYGAWSPDGQKIAYGLGLGSGAVRLHRRRQPEAEAVGGGRLQRRLPRQGHLLVSRWQSHRFYQDRTRTRNFLRGVARHLRGEFRRLRVAGEGCPLSQVAVYAFFPGDEH